MADSFEDIADTCRDVAHAMGVVILSMDHLMYGLFTDLHNKGRRTYYFVVARVERWTTAEEFRALEFAERVANALDVQLRPHVVPQQP